MKESITVKDLGPIKDIHIPCIKPFTVFIGESGSGKSTLMKCISLFRYLFKMENIRSYLYHSKMSKTPFRLNVTKYLKDCGLDEFISANTNIEYSVLFDDGEMITLTFSGEKKKYHSEPKRITSRNIQLNKISFISESRSIIPLWASKGASLAGGYLGFYFHEVYKDFELASSSLKDVSLNHLGFNFNVKKSAKGLEYKIYSKKEGETFDIQFKNSSSGTQSSTPITVITKYFTQDFNFEDAFSRSVLSYLLKSDSLTDFRPVKNLKEIGKTIYIHIEEPELSLYPNSQFLLMEELVNDCFVKSKFPTNLLISTHSPYILNHLNLLIKAYDKKGEGAKVNFDELAVYEIGNGKAESLLAINERLVNVNVLSETINSIYRKYNEL